ncbi:COG1361 S-layer family protein [Haloparvum sedimenti]|uniref:COG1361 S-layer family protein n=1 Tax=Haloparvum sedimenti TaxID=1678448 RepID=UPI00071E77B1|nr:hypothetical protein [Haloparvum sedimenti]
MDRKRIAALVLVSVLLVASGATIVAAQQSDTARGEPDIEAYAPETAFVPGEEATLQITLNNRGDLDERGQDSLESDVITAQSATARIDDSAIPFTVRTGEQPIGDVGEGQTGPIDFTVVPDENVTPGTYEVPLTLEYRHAYRAEIEDGATIRDERDVTETVTVEVEVTDRARFAVVDVDADVQAGTNGLANVTLRNVGEDPARNVSLSMTPTDPDLSYVTEAGTTETFVDRWEPGENRTVTYRLTAAEEATVRPSTVEFEAVIRDAEGAEAETRTIRSGITPLPAQSFSARGVASDLRVNEDGTFTVEVANDGPLPAEEVVVVFENEAPTGGGGGGGGAAGALGGQTVPLDENVVPRDNRVRVGDLGPGENATATFEAGVREDARAGNRTLNVATRYRDAAGDVATSDALDVVVGVAPERDAFAVEAVDPVAERGGETTYEVAVRNLNDEPVSNVEAKLFATDPLDATDDEAFVSEIGPNETTTLSFTVDVGGDASTKAYSVSADFRYDDADGDSELSEAYRLPVDVTEPENGGAATLIAVVAVVLLALLAGVGYWKRESLAARVGRLRGGSGSE